MSLDLVMNHATFRKAWRFEAFAEACAAAGMSRVSIWGDEVDRIGLKAAAQSLRDAGLTAFGYNRAGPFLAVTPDERAEKLATTMVEIDKAAELGADHILVFPGGLAAHQKGLGSLRHQLADMLVPLLEHARSCGVRLALEPLHPMLAGDRSPLCTLAEANALCDALGDGIGIVVDTYHVWWDPAVEQQIELAGASGGILGFHVNDWLVPTSHLLTDRGMMGDGIIDLAHLWGKVCEAGYQGPIEVEIFSEHWWAQDPDLVLQTAVRRCRDIFDDRQGDSQ